MTRLVLACGGIVWIGVTLVLADSPWARRISLARRLTAGRGEGAMTPSTLNWLTSSAGTLGGHVARALGVRDIERLAVR